MVKLIEGLTVFNGRQVPYTLAWVNGHPDFTEVDPDKVRRCLRDRRCGICGYALGTVITFVGGSKSTVFIDPPNHPECAKLAFQECPFLKTSRVRGEEVYVHVGAGRYVEAPDSGDYITFFARPYEYDPDMLISWPVKE